VDGILNWSIIFISVVMIEECLACDVHGYNTAWFMSDVTPGLAMVLMD